MWRLGKLFFILSVVLWFTGNNTLLSQPLSAILPKNQSYLNNFNVSYQWNAYPNAISYKVVQAGNIGFTANLSTSPSINTTSWSSFVNNQGTYYWKVIAYTANDSASSPIYSFNYFTPSSLQSTSLWLKADAGITLDAKIGRAHV